MALTLYNDDPLLSNVTNWSEAFAPSFASPAGTDSFGIQRVPFPVALCNSGVRSVVNEGATLSMSIPRLIYTAVTSSAKSSGKKKRVQGRTA